MPSKLEISQEREIIQFTDKPVDIVRCRSIRRVACDTVFDPFPLVHAYIIDVHSRWKLKMLEVLFLETGRKTKVQDEILKTVNIESLNLMTKTHHRLLGYQSLTDLSYRIRSDRS